MRDKIANGTVVSFHYTLTNSEGELIDKSEDEPLTYLHGSGNIIPGLEKELEGKAKGDELKVTVKPEEGYGEYNPQLAQKVDKTMFDSVGEALQIGMQFEAQSDAGPVQVTVTEITDGEVTVDANHPLAGITLIFDVKIDLIREATQEEIDHGHAH